MENLNLAEKLEQLIIKDRKNLNKLLNEVSDLIKQSEKEEDYMMCHKLLRFKQAMTRYFKISSN